MERVNYIGRECEYQGKKTTVIGHLDDTLTILLSNGWIVADSTCKRRNIDPIYIGRRAFNVYVGEVDFSISESVKYKGIHIGKKAKYKELIYPIIGENENGSSSIVILYPSGWTIEESHLHLYNIDRQYLGRKGYALNENYPHTILDSVGSTSISMDVAEKYTRPLTPSECVSSNDLEESPVIMKSTKTKRKIIII